MRKKCAALSIALACLIGVDPVSAQDICPISHDCSTLFRGFYLGGQVGFVSYSSRIDDHNRGTFVSSFTTTDTNWILGVQAGYDWSCFCDAVTVGFVADWDWSNAKNKTPILPQILDGLKVETELNWLSTFRLRVGHSFSCASLLYFTGGAVLGDFSSTFGVNNPVIVNKFDQTRWGWTAGLGAEFALCGRWTLNTEMLYMHFQTKSVTYAPPSSKNYLDDEAWIGRVGLNYRFSWGY